MTIKEFNTAVDLWSDRIYRFLLKNTRDANTAQDLVQESFEKLWCNRDIVSVDKVKSYLFKIAYNAFIDHVRKHKRQIVTDTVPEVESNEQYSDLNEILEIALNRLPEKYKTIIMLRDYEGYSYKEIAEIMELNEAQVKINIYRARVILKEFIGSVETLI